MLPVCFAYVRKSDMRAKFHFLNDVEAAVGFTSTLMTQVYGGTTTIVPQVKLIDYIKVTNSSQPLKCRFLPSLQANPFASIHPVVRESESEGFAAILPRRVNCSLPALFDDKIALPNRGCFGRVPRKIGQQRR